MNLQEELKKVQARIKALADKADITEAEATELEELMAQSKSLKVRIEAQASVAEADEVDAAQAELDEEARIKALVDKAIAEGAPAINADAAGVAVTPSGDEADRARKGNPFKNLADQCRSVRALAQSQGSQMDVRLKPLAIKQLGGQEGVPDEGGFLLEPTFDGSILVPLHDEGPFSSAVTTLPVSSNSNFGWIRGVDETDRATGSRWGGIRGYWLEEAGTKLPSQPKFRRINWELKKVVCLVYGTDELLQDSSMFETVVNTGCGEEINFMVNDAILNGSDAGRPSGVLNSGALVTVAKESNQTADTIVVENLYKMWARLNSRSKMNSAWYINTDVNPQLDLLSIPSGTAALDPRFVGYDAQGLMRIKGRPVIETEFNPTLGDVGDIVLADMSQYLFWQKGGTEVASSIHVQFLTDQTVFRFVYRCDGQTAMASAVTPYKGSNSLSSFVALAAR
jgi:HK97 family phage major capsid protein